ncbi:MAG: hypothetical protein PHC45_08850 [Clostridiaceae bacterium]|nr:hypothetical protein [Clostridiaceae bacterium]
MKKIYALIIGLLVIAYLSVTLISVNFNLHEFRLTIKTALRQELTLEEMKSTSIYKAYGQIGHDTNIEKINDILDKKSKNIYGVFESWHYPYGYLSVWYREDEKPGMFVKTVSFSTPYTIKLTEKELNSVFECNTPEKIVNILGEPAIFGDTYNKDGEVTDSHLTWGIKTSISEKFLKDTEKKFGGHVSFPLSYRSPISFFKRAEKKLRLSVSIKADNSVESFSLDDYKK